MHLGQGAGAKGSRAVEAAPAAADAAAADTAVAVDTAATSFSSRSESNVNRSPGRAGCRHKCATAKNAARVARAAGRGRRRGAPGGRGYVFLFSSQGPHLPAPAPRMQTVEHDRRRASPPPQLRSRARRRRETKLTGCVTKSWRQTASEIQSAFSF